MYRWTESCVVTFSLELFVKMWQKFDPYRCSRRVSTISNLPMVAPYSHDNIFVPDQEPVLSALVATFAIMLVQPADQL